MSFLAIHHTMQHLQRHIRHLPLPTTGIKPVQNVLLLLVFTKACVLWTISRFCGLKTIASRETMKHLMLVTDQVGLCESWHFFLVWQNMVHGEMLTNRRLLRFTKFPIKWDTKLQIKPVTKFKKNWVFRGIEWSKMYEEVLGEPQDRKKIIFMELQERSSCCNSTWNN